MKKNSTGGLWHKRLGFLGFFIVAGMVIFTAIRAGAEHSDCIYCKNGKFGVHKSSHHEGFLARAIRPARHFE